MSEPLTEKQKISAQWRVGFGARYEKARREAGVTYDAVGKHLGVSRALAHHWYKGLSEISAPLIPQLADFLRVDVGWLISGRGQPRAPMQRLSAEQLVEGKHITADLVLVDIEVNAIRGLEPGDEAVFSRHKSPEPGDITLVIATGRPAMMGRYLPGIGSSYKLATDDDAGPQFVTSSDKVTWRGVLSRRTRFGSR